jgi:hypothetical protein
LIGGKKLAGLGLKQHYANRKTKPLTFCRQTFNDLSVPEVDSIEIADGRNASCDGQFGRVKAKC